MDLPLDSGSLKDWTTRGSVYSDLLDLHLVFSAPYRLLLWNIELGFTELDLSDCWYVL